MKICRFIFLIFKNYQIMLSKSVYIYCKDDISLIENYEQAKNDKSQTWEIHHRREIDENKSVKQLIDEGLYYYRPASELIFLTKSEHSRIHNTDDKKQKLSELLKGEKNGMYGKHHSEEIRYKISESMKGEKNPMYGRTGEKNPMYGRTGEKTPMYGKHHSEETKQKMSEKRKGEKNPMYGKHLNDLMTEEAYNIMRRKQSESLKGKKYNRIHKMYKHPSKGKHRVYRDDGSYYMSF